MNLPMNELWLAHEPHARSKEKALHTFMLCADTLDYEASFPCPSMLGCDDVRLWVLPEYQARVDKKNIFESVYVSGIMNEEDFAGIFIGKTQALGEEN